MSLRQVSLVVCPPAFSRWPFPGVSAGVVDSATASGSSGAVEDVLARPSGAPQAAQKSPAAISIFSEAVRSMKRPTACVRILSGAEQERSSVFLCF